MPAVCNSQESDHYANNDERTGSNFGTSIESLVIVTIEIAYMIYLK